MHNIYTQKVRDSHRSGRRTPNNINMKLTQQLIWTGYHFYPQQVNSISTSLKLVMYEQMIINLYKCRTESKWQKVLSTADTTRCSISQLLQELRAYLHIYRRGVSQLAQQSVYGVPICMPCTIQYHLKYFFCFSFQNRFLYASCLSILIFRSISISISFFHYKLYLGLGQNTLTHPHTHTTYTPTKETQVRQYRLDNH